MKMNETIRAAMEWTVRHFRPREWTTNPRTGLLEPITEPIRLRSGKLASAYDEVDEPDVGPNLLTNVGRVQLHLAGYGTTGLPANGFNYIALSNDALTEDASSTALSNEIAANGLSRAQGTVTLPTGAGTQTTIARAFTASGAQSAQKAGLFDASSGGDMGHVRAFSQQRTLATNDVLTVTATVSLGA